MFCHNCGNRLKEGSAVCLKCGVIIKREEYKKMTKNNNVNIKGIISLVFGIISILLCFNFMLKDISTVGAYIKIIDKLYYAFDLVLAPLLMAFITFVISVVGKESNQDLNKIGLFLSIISFFYIVFEIVIVIIY